MLNQSLRLILLFFLLSLTNLRLMWRITSMCLFPVGFLLLHSHSSRVSGSVVLYIPQQTLHI